MTVRKRVECIVWRQVKMTEETKSDTDDELNTLSQKGKYTRISVLPMVNGKKMEMDTGAAVTLIS